MEALLLNGAAGELGESVYGEKCEVTLGDNGDFTAAILMLCAAQDRSDVGRRVDGSHEFGHWGTVQYGTGFAALNHHLGIFLSLGVRLRLALLNSIR